MGQDAQKFVRYSIQSRCGQNGAQKRGCPRRCYDTGAAGLSKELWRMEDMMALTWAVAEPAKARGSFKQRAAKVA